MNITINTLQINQQQKNISFKGYDARKLTGLIVANTDYLGPLKQACKGLSIDFFSPSFKNESLQMLYEECISNKWLRWTQDYFTVLDTPKCPTISYLPKSPLDATWEILTNFIDTLCETRKFQKFLSPFHYAGGDFFICNKDGKNFILLGKDKHSRIHDDWFKKLYNVEKVYHIPKTDYHLDLSIRPLDNGVVLVSDVEMTQRCLEDGINKLSTYLNKQDQNFSFSLDWLIKLSERKQIENVLEKLKKQLKEFKMSSKFDSCNPIETTNQTVQALEEAGLKPIRVPGGFYFFERIAKNREKFEEFLEFLKQNNPSVLDELPIETIQQKYIEMFESEETPSYAKYYFNNFINAIVHKENGKLHYITNYPLLDFSLGITPEIEKLTGFSTRKAFEKSIEQFVEPSNIRYIDPETTRKIFTNEGGVHCLAAEVVEHTT